MRDSSHPNRLIRLARARLLTVATLVSGVLVAGCGGRLQSPTAATVGAATNSRLASASFADTNDSRSNDARAAGRNEASRLWLFGSGKFGTPCVRMQCAFATSASFCASESRAAAPSVPADGHAFWAASNAGPLSAINDPLRHRSRSIDECTL
jgi:hypothetical protein